jgi:hypothetical protein
MRELDDVNAENETVHRGLTSWWNVMDDDDSTYIHYFLLYLQSKWEWIQVLFSACLNIFRLQSEFGTTSPS